MRPPSYGQGHGRAALRGALATLAPPPGSIFLLADEAALPAAGPVLEAAAQAGVPLHHCTWRAAEAEKTLARLEGFAREAVRLGVDRSSLVLAVGGGVTTDLAGFLAAVLLRGVRWGAVPTTLLGMVDAALGGKTAVDLPEGKNLLGAFHPPEFTVCDVDLLATLPEREWRCGLGEVVKSALVGDTELLRLLEEAPPEELRRPSPALLEAARRAGDVKMRVVEADPQEAGPRKILNLGHTFGHALEAAAGWDALPHGEAVALGLRCALRLAEEMGILEEALGPRVRAVLRRLDLARRLPGPLPPPGRLLELLRRDKKARAGRLDLVLPVRPGECLLVRGVDPLLAVGVLQRELGG